MLCYLAEITAYDASIGGTRTLYYSTDGYTSLPSDTPANQHYEARLDQPGLMRRDIYSQGTTAGSSTTGYGVLELINLGDLDALANYGFDGRQFRILLGDSEAALSTFSVILSGTMEQPEFTFAKLTIRIRDRLAELDKTCQSVLYTGTNSGASGLEGTASDIKGHPKPKLFGQVFNISPPLVNSSQLIYQISDSAIQSIDAVYDQGVALTAGAAYSSISDMTTNAPTAGQYRVYAAGGYLRLGSSPVGQLTCDATQGATTAARTTAQILKSLALLSGTVLSADIYSADVTALDAAASAPIGIWLSNGENIKSAMDEVATSVGAWFGFDRLGRLRMGQLTVPTGSPVLTLTEQDISEMERTATADTDKGVPAYQVRLGYQRNYTVVQQDFKAGITQDRVNWLAQDYRMVSATDVATQTVHLLAPVIERNTLLVNAADAATECARVLALYKDRRDHLTVKTRVNAGINSAIDLTDTVKVQINRFGYNSGKLFRVIGIQPDYRIGKLELTLWG